MKGILIFFFSFLASAASAQQACAGLGQNPSTAFPVCGTNVFEQASVPLCGGRSMPFKSCGSDILTDVNPYWYKFTCFQSGTLGFLITPLTLREDYDWEVYDVTGRSPDDVFTDASLVIGNNWSGEFGATGASTAGTQLFVCGGKGKPLFSQMPQLIAGHNYLLLVSHFSNSQSGYKLSFQGGSAVITDPQDPNLKSVEASCGGDVLRVKISKKIKCNTVSTDGSEFYLSPAATTVKATVGVNCSAQFDTDSLELQLAAPLPPGNYTLKIKKGSDNNTLLDYCDHPVAETETLSFVVLPKTPTAMDSLAKIGCSPKELRLIFKKPILCSSIAANGSDFSINGSYPVNVSAAAGTCASGITKEVVVTLAQPLQKGGSFTIVLNRGSDGNTLLDECSQQTPVGSSLPFVVKDTVNADFSYAIGYGCEKDTVVFLHDGANGVTQWSWDLDEGQQSSLQNPAALYTVFNQPKKITLAVSNGVCRDSATQTITLNNYLKADFSVFADNCPNEAVPFTSLAEGTNLAHLWSFGDGSSSTSKDPSHTYAGPSQQTAFPVRYTVTDSYGCQQTATKTVTIYSSCYLAVPTAFTPNGDGKNDEFRVLNAIRAENLQLLVYNRWGQQVFQTTDWKKGWDGKLSGNLQPAGVYVWFLRYTDRDTKKAVEQKGTMALIR